MTQRHPNVPKISADAVLEALQQHQIVAFLMQDHVQQGLVSSKIEHNLKDYFGPDHFWRLSPLYSQDSDIDDYFQYLSYQLKRNANKGAVEFENLLFQTISSISDRQPGCLFITGFDSGCEAGRIRLAGILRSFSNTQNLRVVITGGKHLAEQIYVEGDLSFLNTAEVIHYPEIKIVDAIAQYAQLYSDSDHISEETTQSLLALSGGHPVLLDRCLKLWSELSKNQSEKQVLLTEVKAALSDNWDLKRLFSPFTNDVERSAQIFRYLAQTTIDTTYPYATDLLLNDLYWSNLLKYEKIDGCMSLVWRGEVLRQKGLSIFQRENSPELEKEEKMNEHHYKTGLELLDLLIKPDDDDSLDKFDGYQDRLQRHLEEYQRYGGSDSDINRDIGELNKLSRKVGGISFNDLCVKLSEREKYLAELLEKIPPAQAQQAAARIVYNNSRISKNRISDDQTFLETLIERYNLPQQENTRASAHDIGPDIDWRGPEDAIQLQSFLHPQSEMLDVGLLLQCSKAVCLVTVPEFNRTGTGFLIAPNRILTSYHVLKFSETEDLMANARDLEINFRYLTNNKNEAAPHIRLHATQPILSQSPPQKLDYILLQINNSDMEKIVQPLSYTLSPPSKGSALHILQHPESKPMQLAIGINGVTGVYQDRARVQYVTRTTGSSSGAPCLNEHWELVALHRGERSRTFGTIREGILFADIYEHIKDYLH